MAPLKPRHTAIAMVTLLGLAVAWEVLTLGLGDRATISEWVWSLTSNPLVPFVAGFLMGHWFFPKSRCVHCGRLPYRRDVPVAFFLALALVGSLAGCGFLPPINQPGPGPAPTPTPTPPPAACMPGVPWCSDVGQECSSTDKPCKHNPTQDPAHCELAPACPEEPRPPDPPPATDCAPVLDPGLSAPPNDDAAWPKAVDQTTPSEFKREVWKAVQRAKQACPAAWVGDCMAAGPSAIDRGYLLIAEELQEAGIAASQAKASSGKIADHLYVRRAPTSLDWNATKLFSYGNGCLITGDGAFTAHGWYTYTGSDQPPPPTDPPPAGGCTAPLPPKVWTAETLPDGWGSDQIGQPRWEIGCVPHGNVVDCTAKVAPRACDYCASIGMGEIGGQPRCGCPVRNECPGFKCEERVACEAYLTGGTKLQTCAEAKAADPKAECSPVAGALCSFVGGNPFQFYPNAGQCRLCSKEDGRVCGTWH